MSGYAAAYARATYPPNEYPTMSNFCNCSCSGDAADVLRENRECIPRFMFGLIGKTVAAQVRRDAADAPRGERFHEREPCRMVRRKAVEQHHGPVAVCGAGNEITDVALVRLRQIFFRGEKIHDARISFFSKYFLALSFEMMK